MNKLRRFLDRITAETYLKMDYFGSKSQKITKRCSDPRPPVQVMWLENVQTLFPLKVLVDTWCRCLAIWGAKRNLYFIFSAPLFKKRFRATGLYDCVYR